MALLSSASVPATWKLNPLAYPVPSVRIRVPASVSACALYGSQMAQASTLPEVSAASASPGCKYCGWMSDIVMPFLVSTDSRW